MHDRPVVTYPMTQKVDVVDTYYAIDVEDPYRWLEDPNSAETKNWVQAQNESTFKYLNSLPGRKEIKKRLSELTDYPKVYTPFNIGGRWFLFKNNGLQNQNVLYILNDLKSEPSVLLDPNKLSDDGTVSLEGIDVSDNGEYLVYKIARSGSDWNEIYVLNIQSGQVLSDRIKWVKFSEISCFKDGFFYSAYDKPNEGTALSKLNGSQKVYFHRFGDAQINDELIFSNTGNPERMYTALVDRDKKYLFILESKSTSGNGLYAKRLPLENSKFTQLGKGFDYDYTPIEVVGDRLLVLTNYNSPRYRLVSIDLNNPVIENWIELIPETENTIKDVSFCGNRLFVEYMVDAKSRLAVYSVEGKPLGFVTLPEICSMNGFNGTKNGADAFYSCCSYNMPGTIFRYNTETGESNEYYKPELKFNADDILVKQEFYTSKDGTRIPLFLIHKKRIVLDGKNMAMLYGYGGFNISMNPSFSTSIIHYVEKGGVYAIACLRGGGEYGEEWHKAGTLMGKQNVFDDFIAAARYLIQIGYTNSSQLAIRGGSNGGLLVGAVSNQQSGLFKVALPAVGVMDMLRYHKFTIGYAWAGDYGTVDDNEEMFRYLYAYSPYHNIQNKKYPAVLVTTADHDDRVVPAHSFKYIARLQEMKTGDLPALIRIDVNAGHGAGKPTAKIIEEFTDILAFVFYHTMK